MMVIRCRQLLVLVFALFLGLATGISSVLASQPVDMQASGTGIGMPADCIICGKDSEELHSTGCQFMCVNFSAAFISTFDMTVDSPTERVGQPPKIVASSRAGRPDPYPPKT